MIRLAELAHERHMEAEEERLGWRVYMERYHYLGARPLVGEHLLYAAFLDTELVGPERLGLGRAASSTSSPRSTRSTSSAPTIGSGATSASD